MKKITAHIPNTITCLNLLSGCMACIFALNFQKEYGSLYGFELAFIMIGMAAVFDFCDGFAARLLHAYSALGKELDSLADLVSFGVAPGLLIYSLLTLIGADEAAYLALFIPVMGALRLAKFNIDDRQTTSFIGLPIPANAIFWIGTTAWAVRIMSTTAANPSQIASAAQSIYYVAIISAIIIPLLMVSNIKMFSLKFKNLDWKENFRRYFIIFATALFLVLFGIEGLAWTIVLYIVISAFLPQR